MVLLFTLVCGWLAVSLFGSVAVGAMLRTARLAREAAGETGGAHPEWVQR